MIGNAGLFSTIFYGIRHPNFMEQKPFSFGLFTEIFPTDGIPAAMVTGRVLYNRNEETFVADYYSLGTQTYASNSFFFGPQDNTDVFATSLCLNRAAVIEAILHIPLRKYKTDALSAVGSIMYIRKAGCSILL